MRRHLAPTLPNIHTLVSWYCVSRSHYVPLPFAVAIAAREGGSSGSGVGAEEARVRGALARSYGPSSATTWQTWIPGAINEVIPRIPSCLTEKFDPCQPGIEIGRMVQGHGEAFAGLRRRPHSGKQRKAQLQEARRQQRDGEAEEAGEVKSSELWWQQGLLDDDERVLRSRLAIARGRKFCQVRIVIHVIAPPAEQPPAAERGVEMASDRRKRQLTARIDKAQQQLSGVRQQQPAAGLATWCDATAAVATILTDASVQHAELKAAISGRLFSLAQQALQTGPLQASQPARFKRLARDGHHADSPAVRAVRLVVVALVDVATTLSANQQEAVSKWHRDFHLSFPEVVELAEGGGAAETKTGPERRREDYETRTDIGDDRSSI